MIMIHWYLLLYGSLVAFGRIALGIFRFRFSDLSCLSLWYCSLILICILTIEYWNRILFPRWHSNVVCYGFIVFKWHALCLVSYEWHVYLQISMYILKFPYIYNHPRCHSPHPQNCQKKLLSRKPVPYHLYPRNLRDHRSQYIFNFTNHTHLKFILHLPKNFLTSLTFIPWPCRVMSLWGHEFIHI